MSILDSLPQGFDRHRDALAIVETGACNPSGITLTLSHALRQIIAEGGSQCADPAVRLIVHQLAFLVNADHIDPAEYGRLLEVCRAKAGTTA